MIAKTLPKTVTLHNPRDPSQHMHFMWDDSWGFVKITYQMGDEGLHSNIIVKVSDGLAMDMFHSQTLNLSVTDSRAMWAYFVDELRWITWAPWKESDIET